MGSKNNGPHAPQGEVERLRIGEITAHWLGAKRLELVCPGYVARHRPHFFAGGEQAAYYLTPEVAGCADDEYHLVTLRRTLTLIPLPGLWLGS
jgi:hypothetical protein